ncbi:MAG TPA: hypothetical protein VLJ21_01275 [Candidatus Binatia bacterium]|nr:hypothetical protein [Candidatus Binatia bacterium]
MGEDAYATLEALHLEEDILKVDACYLALHHCVRAGMPTAVAESYLNPIAGFVEDLPMRHPTFSQETMDSLVESLLKDGEETIVVARRRWHHLHSLPSFKVSGSRRIPIDRTFTYFEHLRETKELENVRRIGLDALNFLDDMTTRVLKPAYTEGVSLQAIIDAETKTQSIAIIDNSTSPTQPIDTLNELQPIPLVKEKSYFSLGRAGRFIGMCAITGMLLLTPAYKSLGKEARPVDYAVALAPITAYALAIGLKPRKKAYAVE